MTMTERHAEELRQRYLADLVNTATPAQRLLMLFDCLSGDLSLAARGFETADLKAVSDGLVHAQHILFALRDPLDRQSELGSSLGGVYDFCLGQLLECNLRKNGALLGPVARLVDQIAAANRRASEAPVELTGLVRSA